MFVIYQARDIAFGSMCLSENCTLELDRMLDELSKSESQSWLLLENLHLAPSKAHTLIIRKMKEMSRQSGQYQV